MKSFYSLEKGIFLLLSLMAFSYSAHSQISITWNGAGDGTTWSDGNNWNGGVAPGPGENAVFLDFDADVSFVTSPAVDVLDIRAGRSVTIDLGAQSLSIGASGKSNVVKINAGSSLAILSGVVGVTADPTRDAFQFRGGSGVLDVAAGAAISISGKKGIWSRPDAPVGQINNSGEISISAATDDGIALDINTELVLFNDICAVIDLGASKIKDGSPSSCVINEGLIIGGGITINKATNNGFYDFGGDDFSTGNNVTDNGVDVTDIVDAGGSCIIDLTAANGGMIEYDWDVGQVNEEDGTLDISGAGLPASGGIISVVGCPGNYASVEVINVGSGPCPTGCLLEFANIANEQCNDNGTPSDPNDDYIIFELDPTGQNLGNTYTVTNASPSTGTYGSPAIFSTAPGTAGNGTVTITITDDDDPTCFLSDDVFDLGTCSNGCFLDFANITNEQCNDNGTPFDPSDDYMTFELDPIGQNLGNTYTVTNASPTSGIYGSPSPFSTAPGTAGNGTVTITISDDDDPSCFLSEDIFDQGTCSNECFIEFANIANEQCNDNGTPFDPTDDYISFELDPTGLNLGNTYSVANASPTTGIYGSPTTFSTAPGTGGGGTVTITIIDDDDPDCFLSDDVFDQGTCSNECFIEFANIANEQCNNNGTPTDPTDDYITFELTPTGFNLGTSYVVTGTNPSPGTGIYGMTTIFSTAPGTAGNGLVTITITDDDDSDCFLSDDVFDPGSCSNECLLELANITNVQCNDNGTPSDATDDYMTFELNPTGFNLGTSYTVTNASPTTGTYGSPNSFSTTPGTAGNGSVTITITDEGDPTCTLNDDVADQGTCSDACLLEFSNISNVQCNDNGTPVDATDDYMTFELNPTGVNLGGTYTVANASPTSGIYGSANSFSTAPGTGGSGTVTITITDDNLACFLNEDVLDQGTCSNDCSLTDANITNVQCNDNGTPADATDDYMTFELNPTGLNLGTSYTLTNASPTTGTYGSATSFSTNPGTAGNGSVTITITDDNDLACVLTADVVDSGTCSNACALVNSGLSNVTCNDNGTPSDATDDFITFELNPTGSNLGTTYTISGAVVSPTGGNYGSTMSYSTPAGSAGMGDLNITITDDADANCSLLETIIDPGSCSGNCNISSSGISNIQCNDGGTPFDPSDDFITFDLDPNGGNLGTNYSITGVTTIPADGNYGSSTNFATAPGTAGAGDLNLAIVDGATSGCTFAVMVADPGSCSNACAIANSGLSNITCNDNGTPADLTDDFITFELNPTGSNLGTTYTISGAVVSPTGGNYGSTMSYSTPAGSAGMGDLNITITDDADANCSLLENIIDPGSCSGNCNIFSSGISNIQCNDGDTPSDPTDDFVTFDLAPMGSNLGVNYNIVGAGVNPNGGIYGAVTNFSTAPGSAGNGDLNITIIDAMDNACSIMESVSDPGSCSAICQMLSIGLTNVTCNDNGTPADATDDFITFELNPTGSNLGTTYTVNGVALITNTGNYGSATNFSTVPGTAGNGDLNITVTDSSSSGCSLQDIIVDPGTCSGTCNLTASGLSNVQCNDGGTSSDPSDDVITFDLDPMGGNLGTNYTVSGGAVTPTGGDYGEITSYTSAIGTAGAGNLDLTITDGLTGNCTFGVTINDPGICSFDCDLVTAGLTNIQCNDNGTPSDDTDDYLTFELNPTGFNLGNSYQVSGGGTITPNIGNYGSTTIFSTQPGSAGMGDLNIIITDDVDGNCSFQETIDDPGSCSGTCNLTAAGLNNIQCNDNGTPSDPSDDYFTFELNPTGSILGNGYSIMGTVVTPANATYGASTTFATAPGTAGAGDLNITIIDAADANCSFSLTITDPGSCSASCNLLDSGLANVECNDNGTPSDISDDFITFDLNPTGSGLGTTYTISGIAATPLVGNYGSTTSFTTPPGTAGSGDLNLTITDDADNNCDLNITILDTGVCDNCPTVEANITPVFGGVCLGQSIDLEFIFNGGTAPYTVRFSDGQGINEVTSSGMSISTFSITPTTTTTYIITEAFDADNCPAAPGASVTVEVFAEATNTFTDSFCEGENYQLPDGRMVNTPDTYEVTLTGQSVNGCDSTITINLSQNQSYDFAETVVVCDTDTYTWNGQTYVDDGIYTASFQAATGCDSLRTLNLSFDGLSIYGAADAGGNVEECLTEAELFGLDVAGTTGQWSSPTGATISPIDQGAAMASDLQSGQNVFIWSISTENCIDFSSDTTVINVLNNALGLQPDFGVFRNTEPIQLSILANDDLNGIDDFELTCINLPSGISSCRFDESTNLLNVEIETQAIGLLEFSYVVCPDECPDACDTTNVQLEITNDQDQVDYIITPENADGLNDVLVFDNLDQFPDNQLVVYNRWGAVVYRAQPYQNNWGGLYKGSRLPEADYYYVMRKELPEKIEFGIVTIKY